MPTPTPRELEERLLAKLIRRAHPTPAQRELIAKLQRSLGLPLERGPADVRFRQTVDRRRIEAARLAVLGVAGQPELMYHYSRVVEVRPRAARNRTGRYHVIRVDSPVPLIGIGLEEAFRLAIIDFRRLTRYTGPLWYVNPADIGRQPPPFYSEELDVYEADYFDIDEMMLIDDELFGETATMGA